MRRKPTASKAQLKPDPRYNNRLVARFVNCMMWDGKKSVAYRIFYNAMDEMKKRMEGRGGSEANELEAFIQAVENVKPAVEIQSKRVGGATYQVPMRVEPDRQIALGIRWIIQAVRKKKGRPTFLKLADELMAATRREGEAFSQREQTHRMADANKAFAHFAH